MTAQSSVKLEFTGLSTDEKPTLEDINTGSAFIEVDTSAVFIWHIDKWYEI